MNALIELGRVSTLTRYASFTRSVGGPFVEGTCCGAALGVAGGHILDCIHEGMFNEAGTGEELCYTGDLPKGRTARG